MRSKALKIGVTTLALAVAFGGLLYSSLRDGTQYYKHVDEVMADPEQWYDTPLQLHGYVRDGSLMRHPDTLEYRFQVTSNGHVVDARYTGVVPDTFKEGSEVVMKGRLSADGFDVEPNGVMAKCPSKYEAQPAALGVPAEGESPSSLSW